MMEETHHFVLSRFERTRNSLERILTITFLKGERAAPISPLSSLDNSTKSNHVSPFLPKKIRIVGASRRLSLSF